MGMKLSLLFATGLATASAWAFTSGTGFDLLQPGFKKIVERGDDGSSYSDKYWFSEANGVGVVTNFYDLGDYEDQRPGANRPREDRCFFVDAGLPLHRTVHPYKPDPGASGPATFVEEPIGMGLCFDSMVQFLATDTPPTLDPAEKLVVWLYDQGTKTNLVVSAGYLGQGSGVTQKDYVITSIANVGESEWHRLTVKAFSDITDNGSKVVGLTVFVDGKEASYSKDEAAGVPGSAIDHLNSTAGNHYTAAKHALYPSFDRVRSTISAATFEGLGAVDDVYFSSVMPNFAVDEILFTLKWTKGVKGFTYEYNGDTKKQANVGGAAGQLTVQVTEDCDTLKVSDVSYSDGFAEGAWLDTYEEPLDMHDGDCEFPVEMYQHGTVVAAPAVFEVNGVSKKFSTFAKLLESESWRGELRVKMINRDPFVWNDEYVSAVQLEPLGYGLDVSLDLNGKELKSDYGLLSVVYVMGGHLKIYSSADDAKVSGGWSEMLVDLQYDGRVTVGNGPDDGHPVTFDGEFYIEPKSYMGAFSGKLEVFSGKFLHDSEAGYWNVASNLADGAAVTSDAGGWFTVGKAPAKLVKNVVFDAETFTPENVAEVASGDTMTFEGMPVIDNDNHTITLGETTVEVPDCYEIEPVDGEANAFVLELSDDVQPTVAPVAAEEGKFRLAVSRTRPGLWYGVSSKPSLSVLWPVPDLWTESENGETIVFEFDRTQANRFFSIMMSDRKPE